MSQIFPILMLSLVITAPTVSSAQTFRPPIDEEVRSKEVEEEKGEEEKDEIETDRDSFTPAKTTVGRQRMVIESAYSFIDNRRVAETHSMPELVARYGLTNWLELRFGTNYEIGGAGNPISGNVPDDFSDEKKIEQETNVSYGLKFDLLKQREWIPKSAFLLQGFTPLSGKETDSRLVATYVSGWTFKNGWSWDSAMRYSTGSLEDDHFNIWSPSTVLKVPLAEQWKAHIEYFGVFSNGRQKETVQHFISPGVHYLITPDLEVGVRFGWGLNDQSPNFFANVGGGFRF